MNFIIIDIIIDRIIGKIIYTHIYSIKNACLKYTSIKVMIQKYIILH